MSPLLVMAREGVGRSVLGAHSMPGSMRTPVSSPTLEAPGMGWLAAPSPGSARAPVRSPGSSLLAGTVQSEHVEQTPPTRPHLQERQPSNPPSSNSSEASATRCSVAGSFVSKPLCGGSGGKCGTAVQQAPTQILAVDVSSVAAVPTTPLTLWAHAQSLEALRKRQAKELSEVEVEVELLYREHAEEREHQAADQRHQLSAAKREVAAACESAASELSEVSTLEECIEAYQRRYQNARGYGGAEGGRDTVRECLQRRGQEWHRHHTWGCLEAEEAASRAHLAGQQEEIAAQDFYWRQNFQKIDALCQNGQEQDQHLRQQLALRRERLKQAQLVSCEAEAARSNEASTSELAALEVHSACLQRIFEDLKDRYSTLQRL